MPLISSSNVGGGGGGSLALVYDSTLTSGNINSTYTVPAGKVFKGYIFSAASSSSIRVNGTFDMSVSNFEQEIDKNAVLEFGGGTSFQLVSGSAFRLYGTLYTNG